MFICSEINELPNYNLIKRKSRRLQIVFPELNNKQWESSLARFEKAKNARKYTKVVDSQDQMIKMPTEQLILQKSRCLAANVKSRQERVVIVVKEAKNLMEKTEFSNSTDRGKKNLKCAKKV